MTKLPLLINKTHCIIFITITIYIIFKPIHQFTLTQSSSSNPFINLSSSNDSLLKIKLNEALNLPNSLEEQRDGDYGTQFNEKELPPHVVVQNHSVIIFITMKMLD
ncbi:hypothetical protein Hanom_Chr09g00768551 [Helianthus anomalus]